MRHRPLRNIRHLKLRQLIALFVLLSFLALGSRSFAASNEGQLFDSSMGMGLNGISDWSSQLPFIDLMKQARSWKDWSDKASKKTIHTDENDWVTKLEPGQTLGTVFLTSDKTPNYDRYIVFYEGDGTIEYQWSARKIKGNAKQKKDLIEVKKGSALLTISKTNPDNPLRNIRIVAERHVNAFEAGQVFNPDWLQKISQFRALRYMDWMKTNNSEPFEWQKRPKLENRTWRANGVPLELISMLSNETRSIPWINIPHWASASFITEMAKVFKGTLDRGLPIYIEHSNEVWNWGFQQAQYALKQGREIWDKEGNAYMQWHGMRTAEMCNAFKQGPFKDDSKRIICTLGLHTHWQGLEKASLECPLWEKSPCVKHGFDAIAVTTYFHAQLNGPNRANKDSDAALEIKALAKDPKGIKVAFERLNQGHKSRASGELKVYPSLKKQIKEQTTYWASVAKKHNLMLVAYEGGQHITANGKALQDDSEVIDFHIAINRSPMMKEAYKTLLSEWKSNGGGLHMHFVDIANPSKWGSWGALEDIHQDTSPKWDALTEFNQDHACWWSLCKKYPIKKQRPNAKP
ncbi:MAG TPA: hypothetical protein VIC26_13205 [Marinagarivorans sp.]